MLPLLRRVCAAAAFLTIIGVVTPAQAVTGYVSGSWYFWNKNGNYCPSNNTCTGAYYTQGGYDTLWPVSNGSVWVVDSSWNIIGFGGTDDDGNYTVAWSRSTFPDQIGVLIFPYQKDGRFFLANSAGQWVNNWFGLVPTAASSSESAPQYVGFWYVGTSAAPDPFYNAYWAIEWQWRYIMNLVGILQSNFTNVEIRGFADTMPGYITDTGWCGTSCAWGPTKQVHLDDDGGFAPQSRAMHEVGHIAEYVTHAWQINLDTPYGAVSGLDYGWGNDFGWRYNFAEWGSAAFEEAFATHYGNITFWADNAETPTTCYASSTTCYDSSGAPSPDTDIEKTSYPHTTNSCSMSSSNPEGRWPLSAMRFFWDVFDNHNDADGDEYTANQGDFWKHLYNLGWYPEGTGSFDIDGTWNSTRDMLDESDARGSISYSHNYTANVTDTYTLWLDNCSPP